MLKMLVYSPDNELASFLRNSIKELFIKLKCNFELSTYSSTENIFKKLKENNSEYDILLLDTKDQETYNIARLCRRDNLFSSIIFIGDKYENINGALLYRPSGYFTRPIEIKNLCKLLLYCYKEHKGFNEYFYIKNKETLERIPYKRIEFFESNKRTITLHTIEKKQHVFYAKLCDVIKVITSNNFVRCHQSYIVNIENVKKLDKGSKKFIMYSGVEVDISKRNYSDIIAFFGVYNGITV